VRLLLQLEPTRLSRECFRLCRVCEQEHDSAIQEQAVELDCSPGTITRLKRRPPPGNCPKGRSEPCGFLYVTATITVCEVSWRGCGDDKFHRRKKGEHDGLQGHRLPRAKRARRTLVSDESAYRWLE